MAQKLEAHRELHTNLGVGGRAGHLVITDRQSLYAGGNDGVPQKISDVFFLPDDAARTSLLNPLTEKIYQVVADGRQWYHDGTTWHAINTSAAQIDNWDTAYAYSQIGHLPLAGGTLTGNLGISNNYVTITGSLPTSTFRRDLNFPLGTFGWRREGFSFYQAGVYQGGLLIRGFDDAGRFVSLSGNALSDAGLGVDANNAFKIGFTDSLADFLGAGTLNVENGLYDNAERVATRSWADTKYAILANNTTFQQDVTITGDLFVNGTQFIANTETVEITDNLLLINNGEVGPGVTAGLAGVEVDRGSATNYQFIFDEASDTFRIGEIGDLQPVATREASPLSGGYARWNDIDNRYDAIAPSTVRSDIGVDKTFIDSLGINAATLGGLSEGSFLRSDISDIFSGSTLFYSTSVLQLLATANNQRLILAGGSTASSSNGAYIAISGVDFVGQEGNIVLQNGSGGKTIIPGTFNLPNLAQNLTTTKALFLNASDAVAYRDLGSAAFVQDSDLVHRTGAETINGAKTFTEIPVIARAGSAVLDLRDMDGSAVTSNAYIRYLDDTNTRIGYVGFGSSLHANLSIRNDVPGGHIILDPLDATGFVGIGAVPTHRLHVAGAARIETIANAAGDFVTVSASGVLQKRTASQAFSDFGVNVPSDLSELDDVAFASLAIGDIFSYNGTQWRNATLAQAGIEPAFVKNTGFNLNLGTTAGTVSEGDHNHTGLYEPAFSKNSAFNKNFGTTAGMVSEGNHTHAQYITLPEAKTGYAFYQESALGAVSKSTSFQPFLAAGVIPPTDTSYFFIVSITMTLLQNDELEFRLTQGGAELFSVEERGYFSQDASVGGAPHANTYTFHTRSIEVTREEVLLEINGNSSTGSVNIINVTITAKEVVTP